MCPQQEPSADPEEIMNLIRYVRPGNNFEPAFPIFSRSDVNGAGRIPVYQWALVRRILSGNICNS